VQAAGATSRTLKLVLAYDGTDFVGWQRQARGVSVQGLLEDALARVEGRPVTIVGAGRTDAGVHAIGQVASCRLAHQIPAADLRRALNAMLPPPVRVRRVEAAADDFHARYAAIGKTYRYVLLTGDVASPFLHRYAWHLPSPVDAGAMAAAARLVEGRHDFSAFQSTGSTVATTIRTVTVSAVTGGSPPEPFRSWIGCLDDPASTLITYEITGDGFLRHMVRAIVGSLVHVGLGRQDPAWIADLLRSGRRGAAGPTAPACGLWLVGVQY
jgi:tRNA pseudouridine38-40 synthase